jgi:membrane-associated phospholipid phosphatase/diacylglycerol kinase family enzyme
VIIARPRGAFADLVRVDRALFARVARGHTPWLDRVLPLLSRTANNSRLWMAVAGGLAVGEGRRGQRAAVRGLGSIAVTSLLVNQGIKRLVRRPRPSLHGVPVVRRVPVAPLTTSFPSGHAASAGAFAAGVAAELPPAGVPLGVLAAAVGGSRVYVGVHYPLDVIVGAGIGAAIATLSCRLWPVLPQRADELPPSEDRRALRTSADGQGVGVLVNPGSGSGTDPGPVDALRRRLPRARIIELGDGSDLESALAEVADACEVLGVCGGDGSVTAAARVALARSRPLLMLPGGTLNHLARDLRIESADDAIDALTAGEAVGVDVAAIDGRPFLNTAGFGSYPDMLDARQHLERRLGRWPAQLIALGKTLLRAEPLELTIDGERRLVWMGFVGNCRHEPAGFAPSWRPRLDDGCLDVRILLADLPLARPRLMLSILTGRLAASHAYRELSARQLRVESTRPRRPLACDGETFEGHGRFLIEKLPQPVVIYARHTPRT